MATKTIFVYPIPIPWHEFPELDKEVIMKIKFNSNGLLDFEKRKGLSKVERHGNTNMM